MEHPIEQLVRLRTLLDLVRPHICEAEIEDIRALADTAMSRLRETLQRDCDFKHWETILGSVVEIAAAVERLDGKSDGTIVLIEESSSLLLEEVEQVLEVGSAQEVGVEQHFNERKTIVSTGDLPQSKPEEFATFSMEEKTDLQQEIAALKTRLEVTEKKCANFEKELEELKAEAQAQISNTKSPQAAFQAVTQNSDQKQELKAVDLDQMPAFYTQARSHGVESTLQGSHQPPQSQAPKKAAERIPEQERTEGSQYRLPKAGSPQKPTTIHSGIGPSDYAETGRSSQQDLYRPQAAISQFDSYFK